MEAIDWSHTKNLTVYDGRKASIIDRKALLKRLAGESTSIIKSISKIQPASPGVNDESTAQVKSTPALKSSTPTIILEQGCPLSLIYDILKTGSEVKVISSRATQDYRVVQGIKKTDANDAKIIWELANNGAKLTPISLGDSQIQLIDLYQRYKRYQKARVAMMNMRKAYIRQFGDGRESIKGIKSITSFNLPSLADRGDGESIVAFKSMDKLNPSSPAIKGGEESKDTVKSIAQLNSSPHGGTLPYDIAIDTLKTAENSCLKKVIKLASPVPESLKIRGLGPRLWAGIYITANPVNFITLSSYLRYCGLVNLDQLDHKWNRHARMLYHMLAGEVMKQRDPIFRPIYDRCKADIAERHPDYTKLHIHRAALNRTATFLAKELWQKGRPTW